MIREIRLSRSILASNFRRLNEPYKLILALTYRCNLKCKTCGIWKNPPKKEMEVRDIEKLMKSLKYLSWLDLSGGEITLREDLLEIIETIIKNSKKLLIFHISTNGQLPAKTEVLVKKILEFGVIPVVNISVKDSASLVDGVSYEDA